MVYKDLTFLLFAKDMGTERAFNNVSRNADSMKTGVSSAMAGMGVAVAGAAIAYGAASVKMAADFQTATTRIITDGGGAGESVSKLGAVITDAGVQTGTSMTEAAAAMYKLSSAGFTLNKGGGAALIATLQGAKIGGADAVTVADALSTTMTDFGYKGAQAAKVMSMLTATVATGKTNLQDLAGSLHSVLPNAQAAGLGLQETLAAIGTMTAEGVSAQQATENLANAISALQAPSLVSQHAMQGIGVTALDVAKNLGKRGLAATYEDLLTHMAKSSHAGMVVVNSFAASAQAGSAMKAELAKMPPTLRDLAVSFQAGHLTSRQWAADLKPYPATVANLGRQFATTVKHASGFSDALKSGEGPIRTSAEQLQKMLGGATGLSVALHLTGEHMDTFKANTKSITAATTEADGSVRGWAETQGTFNQQMSEAKAGTDALSKSLGDALLPGIGAIASTIPGAVHWLLDAQKAVKGFDISVLESVRSVIQWTGGLEQAGTHAVEGLVQGIEAGANDVKAAVSWVSSLIPQGVRNFLQINSPSKVMIPIGRGVGEGLQVGLLGSADAVKSTASKLASVITGQFKAGDISKGAEDAALGTVTRMSARLQVLSKQRDAVNSSLSNLRTDRSNLVTNVRTSTLGQGDITGFAATGDAVEGLQSMIRNTRQFKVDLWKLRHMGVGQTMFAQLVQGWQNDPANALRTANELIANPIDLKEIVGLQRQLGAASADLGNYAGAGEYGAAINTRAGQSRVLTWEMQRAAASGLNRAAAETHIHLHLSGTYAGTRDDLAKTVYAAFKDAVKRGAIPKNAYVNP